MVVEGGAQDAPLVAAIRCAQTAWKEHHMAQRVQGTEDLFGGYMRAWQHMQDVARDLFGAYGFDMVETPAIEQVDTFVHGIGESTDVVRKEMFRVVSGALFENLLEQGSEAGLKPKQRLAMRPEGTAGVVRAAVENNMVPQGAAPAKLWYAEAMFRGERPQKGRVLQAAWVRSLSPAPLHQLDGRRRLPSCLSRESSQVHPRPRRRDVRGLPGTCGDQPTA